MFVRQKGRGSGRRPKDGARGKGGGKSAAKRREQQGLPRLEQRHLDLIGLGLVVLGVYLFFVLYMGWAGGKLGSGLAEGLTYLIGKVAYAVPVALLAIGGLLMFRPSIPATKPLRTGAVCLTLGLLLAFAGETFGIAGGGPERGAYFDSGWFPEHGGLVGESLYWLTTTLFQTLGSHLIAFFLLVAGVLLLTGTTIATVFSHSGRAIRRTGSRGADMTRTIRRRGSGEAAGSEAETVAARTEAIPADVMADFPDETGEPPTMVINEPEELDIWALDREIGAEADGEDEEPSTSVTGDFGDELDELETEIPPEQDLPEEDEEEGLAPDPATLEQEAAPGPGEADPVTQPQLTPAGKERGVTVAEQIDYRAPSPRVLEKGKKDSGPDPGDQEALGRKLVETLGHFGVEAKIVGIVSGPHVSRFELRLAPGTKVKKVSELANDLAYALASTDIRILAPIPGKQAVGVEVPNARRRMVRLGDIYADPSPKDSPLTAWLGKGIDGNAVSADLAKMPHVLVAGTTGSGKSGCVNAILSSILMHSSPNDVRLVLVDPKQVELNHYEAVPHLLTPVVTSPKLAANVLQNLIVEMESRYGIMSQARARNLAELNKIRGKEGEPPLPHILCVIDELADLMMVSAAEVEDSIIRLAQKSRATGIHLVLATQRPSTDIITGTIKVNIPARIAFAVSSQTDSRVILDQGGAESLLGQGDMLYRGPGTSKLARIQGAFVTEDEIARITDHWSAQGEPEFEQELLEARSEAAEGDAPEGDFDPDQDDLLDEAIRLVVQTETASVSMIQRRLRVGYTRAGRLVDMLERRGVISGYEGSKPRQVLITEADLPRVLAGGDGAPADAEGPAGATAETAAVGSPEDA